MTIEDRRLKLHEVLCKVLGSREVYYDPPESVAMKYPAIIYSKSRINMQYADNRQYLRDVAYSATLIRKDDDEDVLDRLLDLEYVVYDRSYVSNNLHHDVFSIFV